MPTDGEVTAGPFPPSERLADEHGDPRWPSRGLPTAAQRGGTALGPPSGPTQRAAGTPVRVNNPPAVPGRHRSSAGNHGPEPHRPINPIMVLANIFQPLIDIFGPVLVFLHSIIGGSWGWSIIALTVVVRALLLPLAFKQMHSMQKLQQVAPQMKAIQAKYKDDKQRQQSEIMRFYKENEINPFASFLPLLAQIPVFIGLFYTLRTRLREDICPGLQAAYRHAYALHHNIPLNEAAGHTTACHGLHGSSWLFIHDLTNTATGLTLVVLIVLYVGTQLASSLTMRAPTMDQTQRRMMLLLPLFFVIFIISFPAGLILYWITTNTWTMGQQWVIRGESGQSCR